MTRQRTRSLLFAALPLMAFSQITITPADHPSVGDQWTVHVDSNGDPLLVPTAPGSSAQTWNYVPPFGLTNDYALNWTTPASVAGGALFPDAELAIDQGNNSSFYLADATGLYHTGSYVSYPGFNTTEHIVAGLVLPMPFTYGDERSGEEVSTEITRFDNNDPAQKIVHRQGWTIICEAFGTVQTPAYPGGTAVLRLAWDRGTTVDSTFTDAGGSGNGPWIFNAVSSSPGNLMYIFVQNGSRPLVIDVAAGGTSAAYYSAGQPDAVAENSPRIRQVSAYPVPTWDDMVHIPLGDAADIRTVEVMDAMGGTVHRQRVGGTGNAALATGSFATGTYTFRCLNEQGTPVGYGRFVVAR